MLISLQVGGEPVLVPPGGALPLADGSLLRAWGGIRLTQICCMYLTVQGGWDGVDGPQEMEKN